MDQYYLHLSQKMDEHHEISQEEFKEIRTEIKEIKRFLETDVAELKVQAETCKGRWTLMGKTLSLSGFGAVIMTFLAKLFGG